MKILAGTLLAAAAVLAFAWTPNTYVLYLAGSFAITAIAAVGLNLLFGLAGSISLGQAGFLAIGAYTVAILTMRAHADFWIALAAAVALSTIAGVALSVPALRVRGPYLAMITIAFGIIVQHAAIEFADLTGGFSGISGITKPALDGVPIGQRGVVASALALLAGSLLVFASISTGPWGRAMRAVRDQETAAAAIGIDVVVPRAFAFGCSAAAAGLAGGLFAPLASYINPQSFDLQQSILLLLAVILGGAGTMAGPVLGAAILVLLPEVLAGFAEYRLLIFGAMLFAIIWLVPRGIVGSLERHLPRRVRSRSVGGGDAARAAAFLQASAAAQPLVARDISIAFGGVHAVDHVDLTAQPSTITSIIGPNGAGKTTLLNCISGFYRSAGGSLRLGDAELRALPSHRIARRGIARTFQATLLFDELSALDNVRVAHERSNAADPQPACDLLAFVGFDGDPDKRAGALPLVERRLVEIARALALRPAFVLLDEPAGGLLEGDKQRLRSVLRAIVQTGIGVVLIEHDMPLVMDVSDHVLVLDAGRRIAEGPPAAVAADPLVREAYLGDAAALGDEKRTAARAGSGTQIVLDVRELVAGYGELTILRGVSLQVCQGEFVSVVGANGAGKTTLLNAIAGLVAPRSGTIDRHGHRIAVVPEGRQLFPELSVSDNLLLAAPRRGAKVEADLEQMFDRFPRLRERAGSRAGLLSGGEAQMLAIARALIMRPDVLILDEPSLGLAPKLVDELYDTLAELRDRGLTMLLADQMISLAFAISDRAYVIENGTIVHAGRPDRMRDDPRLAAAYFGSTGAPAAAGRAS